LQKSHFEFNDSANSQNVHVSSSSSSSSNDSLYDAPSGKNEVACSSNVATYRPSSHFLPQGISSSSDAFLRRIATARGIVSPPDFYSNSTAPLVMSSLESTEVAAVLDDIIEEVELRNPDSPLPCAVDGGPRGSFDCQLLPAPVENVSVSLQSQVLADGQVQVEVSVSPETDASINQGGGVPADGEHQDSIGYRSLEELPELPVLVPASVPVTEPSHFPSLGLIIGVAAVLATCICLAFGFPPVSSGPR